MAATQPTAMRSTATAAERRDDATVGSARQTRLVLVGGIAIAVFVLFWVGLMALAASLSDVGYAVPLAMGAAVGVLAGVFWAGWYAFVIFSHHEHHELAAARQRRMERSDGAH